MGCPGKDQSELGLLLLRDEFKNGIKGMGRAFISPRMDRRHITAK